MVRFEDEKDFEIIISPALGTNRSVGTKNRHCEHSEHIFASPSPQHAVLPHETVTGCCAHNIHMYLLTGRKAELNIGVILDYILSDRRRCYQQITLRMDPTALHVRLPFDQLLLQTFEQKHRNKHKVHVTRARFVPVCLIYFSSSRL